MCQKPLDIVLVLDRSSSLRDVNPSQPLANWYLLRNFTSDFISGFDVHPQFGAQFGVITFATEAISAFLLDRYRSKTDLLKRVAELPYGSGK